MTVALVLGGAIVAVLVLAEVSARLWRRTHPTPERFRRVQQTGVFRGLWMLVLVAVVAVLAATHVLGDVLGIAH